MKTKKTMELRKAGDSRDTLKTQISREEVERIDYEVLSGMSDLNRKRLTHADPATLTLRQLQTAGAEFIASLAGHPRIRKSTIEAAIKDPIAIQKIASSERPKEVHMEADINHSVVVVPAQQSAEEWERQVRVIEVEVLKEESW